MGRGRGAGLLGGGKRSHGRRGWERRRDRLRAGLPFSSHVAVAADTEASAFPTPMPSRTAWVAREPDRLDAKAWGPEGRGRRGLGAGGGAALPGGHLGVAPPRGARPQPRRPPADLHRVPQLVGQVVRADTVGEALRQEHAQQARERGCGGPGGSPCAPPPAPPPGLPPQAPVGGGAAAPGRLGAEPLGAQRSPDRGPARHPGPAPPPRGTGTWAGLALGWLRRRRRDNLPSPAASAESWVEPATWRFSPAPGVVPALLCRWAAGVLEGPASPRPAASRHQGEGRRPEPLRSRPAVATE